ncbi:MAG TPA: GNAT family N-acetyltransferase [Thermoplasmata archaeon]|nr:GNAT family N-acetyltransferase [Thermoplasmata archaeon]
MTLRTVARRRAERDTGTLAVLEEFGHLLEGLPNPGVRDLGRIEEPRLENGELTAAVEVGPGGAMLGVVVWDLVPGVGRRVVAYLRPSHASRKDWELLLEELEARSEHDGPLASVTPVGPESSAPEVADCFARRGYFEVDRLVLRLPSDRPLPDELASAVIDLRPLSLDDEDQLIELMREAYDIRGGEQNPWLFYRDPRRDVRDAVHENLSGRWGTWLPWASFGFEVSGKLRAAILVNRVGVPRVTDVIVAPAVQGIGVGYHLILHAARVLRERGEREPELITPSHDLRALRLFRRVGFEPVDGRGETVWVRREAVGAPPPL